MTRYKSNRPGASEDRPLLTAAAERTSEQHAMLRSLTCEQTGLSLKTHNRLIGLLVQIVSYFSDGTTTSVRVSVLADSLHKSRATIFRALADARAIGFMASESREGTVGQTISSDRSIDWSAIAAKLGRETPSWATNSPRNDVRRPRLNCDTPVSTETGPVSTETPPSQLRPLIEQIDPDRSERTERNPRSGSPDARTKRIFDSKDLEAKTAILFDKLGYRGREGQTLWLAVAAMKAGELAESDVSDAIAAVRAIRPRDPVAYFRRVLGERIGRDNAGLRDMFQSLRILPRCPCERPEVQNLTSGPVERPTLRATPRGESMAQVISTRRNAILDALETVNQPTRKKVNHV